LQHTANILPFLILALIFWPSKNNAQPIGAVGTCKHSICGTCSGYIKRHAIGTTLNEVCSSKCQAARGKACVCKCNGVFHAGNNSKKLQKILNPQLKAQSKKNASKKSNTAYKQLLSRFEPETIEDYLAMFLTGTKIKTSSFDRFGDRNNRKNTAIALNWLNKEGASIDVLAKSFNDLHQFGIDEKDTIQMIVDFITENPGGVGTYVKNRINEMQSLHTMNYGPMIDNSEETYYKTWKAPQELPQNFWISKK
jgi:hypothetical protein